MCSRGPHHHQTQSFSPRTPRQPPLCQGVSHGTGGGAHVGALCFVRLSVLHFVVEFVLVFLPLVGEWNQLTENHPLTAPASLQRPQGAPPSACPLAPGCLSTPAPQTAVASCRGEPFPAHPLLALSLARAWSQLPRRSLGSHRCDPHDQLAAAALRGPLFMRSQVTQDVQDGVSTVVIGQGARGVASRPGRAFLGGRGARSLLF